MKYVNIKFFAKATAILLLFLLVFCCVSAAGNILDTFAFEKEMSREEKILNAAFGFDASEDFEFLSESETSFGKILRYCQVYNNVQIEGAQITITVDKDDKILSSNLDFVNIPNFASSKMTPEAAKQTVKEIYFEEPDFCEQTYFYDGEQVYDCFKVGYSGGDVRYVSRQTGEIVFEQTDRSVIKQNTNAFGKKIDLDVFYDGSKYYLKDEERHIFICDAKGELISDYNKDAYLDAIYSSESGDDFDAYAVTVFDGIKRSYDFYADASNIGTQRFGINDKNNNGDASDDFTLYVFLDHCTNYRESELRTNAVYSNMINNSGDLLPIGLIRIGEGDGSFYDNYMDHFAKALDVIAHEYQHGITSHTANFGFLDESGAMDEAFSDIFGALIEGNDPCDLNSDFWKIGENCVKSPATEMRSLIGGTPDQRYSVEEKHICLEHKNNRHDKTCDNGYVHDNSTIISHVQYELSSLSREFFTRERIGTLWYTTLLKLTPSSNFEDFGREFLSSARELGYSDEIYENVKKALSAVGIIKDGYHTVTFYGADNAFMAEYLVKNNDSVLLPAAKQEIISDSFTYKFKEWQNEDGTLFDSSKLENITEDIKVYAYYQKYFIVNFADSDGNILHTEEIEEGNKVPQYDPSEAVDNKKFEFLGWVTDETAEGFVIDFENFIPHQNVTFKPLLRIRKYYVRFHFSDDLTTPLTFEYGSAIDRFPTAKREGYKFAGWYLDKDLTVDASSAIVEGDMDVYAKWERDDDYDQNKTAIIVGASLAAALIILIPVVILLTRRRKRR